MDLRLQRPAFWARLHLRSGLQGWDLPQELALDATCDQLPAAAEEALPTAQLEQAAGGPAEAPPPHTSGARETAGQPHLWMWVDPNLVCPIAGHAAALPPPLGPRPPAAPEAPARSPVRSGDGRPGEEVPPAAQPGPGPPARGRAHLGCAGGGAGRAGAFAEAASLAAAPHSAFEAALPLAEGCRSTAKGGGAREGKGPPSPFLFPSAPLRRPLPVGSHGPVFRQEHWGAPEAECAQLPREDAPRAPQACQTGRGIGSHGRKPKRTRGGWPRPPLNYCILISLALSSSVDSCLTVQEIYKFTRRHFPFFRTAPEGWKNTVRHNLCFSSCFEKTTDFVCLEGNRKSRLWKLTTEGRRRFREEAHALPGDLMGLVHQSMDKPELMRSLFGL